MNAVAPTAPFDPTKFDAAQRTLMLRKLRAKMKEIKERHEAELADFKNLENKLVGEMIAFLQATKQQSAKNVNGTPYLLLKVTYSVQDQEAYKRHVIGSEAWELITWGCAKEAADAFVEANGAPPPGVKRSALVTLGVLGPPKPKTKVIEGTVNVDENGVPVLTHQNGEVESL